MIDQEKPVAEIDLKQYVTILVKTPEATYEISYVDTSLCVHCDRHQLVCDNEKKDQTIVIWPEDEDRNGPPNAARHVVDG